MISGQAKVMVYGETIVINERSWFMGLAVSGTWKVMVCGAVERSWFVGGYLKVILDDLRT